MRAAIIDYGMGNLGSVARAVKECGGMAVITSETATLRTADVLILPGVGAFGDAMCNMRHRGLDDAVRELVLGSGGPILGICLGMQLLFSWGGEGDCQGLSFVKGVVKRFIPTSASERIPHVGWNDVIQVTDDPLFRSVPSNKDFYFVHSFHCLPTEYEHCITTTPCCGYFCSSVRYNNVVVVQFNPEKSQSQGFAVLNNFLQQSC